MVEITPRLTADGSLTFFSPQFNETFHSLHGARQEAEFKFVQPTRLIQLANQPVLRLLDICYGLGYNTAAALEAIWRVNPGCQVQLLGLELDAEVPKLAVEQGLPGTWSEAVQQVFLPLATYHQVQTDRLQAHLWIGDARQTIQRVAQLDFRADAIFLDPFSPPRCPQLWTVEFLSWVSGCLQPAGRLATYSCAAAIRTALRAAGLQIGSTAPIGRRSPGTIASCSAVVPELSQQEQEHLLTRAAIPYRDPALSDTAAMILERRRTEQQASDLEQTSQWKKRWF